MILDIALGIVLAVVLIVVGFYALAIGLMLACWIVAFAWQLVGQMRQKWVSLVGQMRQEWVSLVGWLRGK